MDEDRTFTVATDAAVISLIESAKRRLVVIALHCLVPSPMRLPHGSTSWSISTYA